VDSRAGLDLTSCPYRESKSDSSLLHSNGSDVTVTELPLLVVQYKHVMHRLIHVFLGEMNAFLP
jgi:hypothetical protein